MANKVNKVPASATKHIEKALEENSLLTAAKFKWINELVRELLDSLKEFELTMKFNNFNLNTDKPR